MSLDDIRQQLAADDADTRAAGADALATATKDGSLMSTDGFETDPFELVLLAATDDDTDTKYGGTKALSRLLKNRAAIEHLQTATLENERTYLSRVREVGISNLANSNAGKVRSRAALVVSRLASNGLDNVSTDEAVESLIDLLQTGAKRIRRQRAALALTNLAHYDKSRKDYVRKQMATAADTLTELAAADSNIPQSVGLRAIGFMGLSSPDTALPVTEVRAVAHNDEARPRNMNRAIRSLWQIGRTHPSVLIPAQSTLADRLYYTGADAKDADYKSGKDKSKLGKHAGFIRSNAAFALATLAREYPDRIRTESVERSVELVRQRDEAIHRAMRLLGQVHDSHGTVLDRETTEQTVHAYLAAQRESETPTKRHTKARGYGVWLLTRLSDGDPVDIVPDEALEYLSAVPVSEQTEFGPLRTEAVTALTESHPEAVSDNEASVSWLCKRAVKGEDPAEQTDAVRGLGMLCRSGEDTADRIVETLDDRLLADPDPSVRTAAASALGAVSDVATRRVLANASVTESRDSVAAAIAGALQSMRSASGKPGASHPLAPTELPVVPATEYTPWLQTTIEYGDIEQHNRIRNGGTGTVHRASLHPPSDAVVETTQTIALKQPREPSGATITDISEYITEAEQWATVHDHPNIVTVLGWGGQPYAWIAMEYVTEGELGEYVEKSGVSVSQALWIGVCIADALQHAHSYGIYHHDITPANILLDARKGWPLPKLADWGTARKRHDLSRDGQGYTAGYAAPEQRPEIDFARTVPPGKTDIYQLATVIFELLTGTKPFPDGEPMKKRSTKPTAPSALQDGVPKSIDQLLLAALSPDPDDRPETAARFRDTMADL